MEGFKFTNMKNQTHGGMQWGEGVEWCALGLGTNFCSPDLIHFYDHPLLALLHNPIHADYNPAHLWRGEAAGKIFTDNGVKWGCKRFRTIEKIPLPAIGPRQRVAYGILCALAVCDEPNWVRWAESWLNGTDRSLLAANVAYTANAAAYTARAAAARSAANAAAAYAASAACAASAAYAVAYAALPGAQAFSLLAYAQAALLVPGG